MKLENFNIKLPAISEIDIGWTAGFYEGEGSCVATNSNSCYISVTQKDPEPLVKLQKLFGGEIKVYNGYNYWRIYGEQCKIFVFLIFDYLSDRRKKQILRYENFFISPDSCPNNHIYIDGSYKIVVDNRGRSYRSCLECDKEKGRRNREPLNKAALAYASATGMTKEKALEFLTNAKVDDITN